MKENTSIIKLMGRLIENDQISPYHVSLYVSLLQFWILNRLENPFRIYREEIMICSKIKSIATYHKCIKDLCVEGFIIYFPSFDPSRGSSVGIICSEEVLNKRRTSEFQKKFLLQKENIFIEPEFNEIKLYFEERNKSCKDANSFYTFYKSINWQLNNQQPMKSWQAAARKWITKNKDIE
jgi:hypothetical protein